MRTIISIIFVILLAMSLPCHSFFRLTRGLSLPLTSRRTLILTSSLISPALAMSPHSSDLQLKQKLTTFLSNKLDREEGIESTRITDIKGNKILSAKIIDYQNMEILGSKVKYTIIAYDDSCGVNDSHADIKVIRGNIEQLVGHEIVRAFTCTEDEKQVYYPGQFIDGSCENYDLHIFEISNGESVHILGRHVHNGWYGGGSILSLFLVDEALYAKNENSRVVIVVGLPASGKSTYVEANFGTDTDFKVFDDFLYTFEIDVTIVSMLERGKNIVLCDPRLCSLVHFKEVLAIVSKVLVSSNEQLFVVYFENDLDKCLANVHRPRLDDDIKRLHGVYGETIEFIESMGLEGVSTHRLPVYYHAQSAGAAASDDK